MKPTVPEVLPIAIAYIAKEGNATGGNLHCVLEDGNIEDKDLAWSLRYALDEKDDDAVKICELMLRMSKTQRRKLVEMLYDS